MGATTNAFAQVAQRIVSIDKPCQSDLNLGDLQEYGTGSQECADAHDCVMPYVCARDAIRLRTMQASKLAQTKLNMDVRYLPRYRYCYYRDDG